MSSGTDFTPPDSFSYVPFNEYVGQEALSLPPQQQDFCLNITDPPSIYSYSQYSALWQPAWCMLWNVTLSGRVDSQGKSIISRRYFWNSTQITPPPRLPPLFYFQNMQTIWTTAQSLYVEQMALYFSRLPCLSPHAALVNWPQSSSCVSVESSAP